MTRTLTINDLHWTVRETVRWATIDLGWTLTDCWEDKSWGDDETLVDHIAQLRCGTTTLMIMAGDIGARVAVMGGIKVRHDDGAEPTMAIMHGLPAIAVAVLEHGRIDLRAAS